MSQRTENATPADGFVVVVRRRQGDRIFGTYTTEAEADTEARRVKEKAAERGLQIGAVVEPLRSRRSLSRQIAGEAE